MALSNDTKANPPRRPWSRRGLLAALEPLRATGEFAALGASLGPLMLAPRGDGHTVLVLPGLGASDTSTTALRQYLSWVGYRALPWEVGTNSGITRSWAPLVERVHAILDPLPRDEMISLVGWSLGGTLSLGLAQAMPKRIRRVITLGSPQLPEGEHAAPWIRAGYRFMNPTRVDLGDLFDELTLAQRSTPHTAIYSRSDAIVPWEIAMGRGSKVERIEVIASHLGLGVNPGVLYAVADRLHGRSGAAFRPPLLLSLFYGSGEQPANKR